MAAAFGDLRDGRPRNILDVDGGNPFRPPDLITSLPRCGDSSSFAILVDKFWRRRPYRKRPSSSARTPSPLEIAHRGGPQPAIAARATRKASGHLAVARQHGAGIVNDPQFDPEWRAGPVSASGAMRVSTSSVDEGGGQRARVTKRRRLGHPPGMHNIRLQIPLRNARRIFSGIAIRPMIHPLLR